MLVTDSNRRVGGRRFAEEEHDAFSNEAFAAIPEEINDLVFESFDGANVENGRFLAEFPSRRGEIILSLFDMTLGEVPMLPVVQQEVKPTACVLSKNDEAGRTLVSRHAGFYPSIAATASF